LEQLLDYYTGTVKKQAIKQRLPGPTVAILIFS